MADKREYENRSTPLQRVRAVFDLYETAELIMRQNLRRRYPLATGDEIEVLLERWRRNRPGAQYGDGVGRPVLGKDIDEWLTSRLS